MPNQIEIAERVAKFPNDQSEIGVTRIVHNTTTVPARTSRSGNNGCSARAAAAGEIIEKKIPSSGEMIPVVGWITFNVGNDRELQDECAEVMRAFFASGGRPIDSSPMYGSSQATIGYGLEKLGLPTNLFAADKVWISSPEAGPAQIGQSQTRWGIPRFRLLQVHNLLSWEQHLSSTVGIMRGPSHLTLGHFAS